MPTIMHQGSQSGGPLGTPRWRGSRLLPNDELVPTVLKYETPTNAATGTCIPSDFTRQSITVHEARLRPSSLGSQDLIDRRTPYTLEQRVAKEPGNDFPNRRADKELLMNRCYHFHAAAWPRVRQRVYHWNHGTRLVIPWVRLRSITFLWQNLQYADH